MLTPGSSAAATEDVVVLDGSGAQPSAVGGKAAALDRLISWSMPVPPTAVVTAAAFHRVVDSPPLRRLIDDIVRSGSASPVDADRIDRTFEAAGLPPDLADAIVAAARLVGGGGRVAIRSSATVEDLAGSSFAGQYRSVLEVDPSSPDEVVRGVLAVFASLYHPAPRAYRAARGIGETSIAMAAVVMRMIDARRAGVVFTQDPTVVEPLVRVEAVEGLGDDLVSGRRTPSVTRIPRCRDVDTIDMSRADGASATPEVLLAVEHALAIEHLAGAPQDVEWAWDGTDVWIVQARPITATSHDGSARGRNDDLTVDPLDDDPASLHDAELTTEGIGEMLPGVLPPLVWEVASYVVDDAFRTMLDRLGADVATALPARWSIRRVHGRAALDVGRLGVMMSRIPGADARVRAAYGLDVGGPGALGTTAGPTPARRHVFRHTRRTATARRQAAFDADVAVHAVAEIESHPIDPDRHTTAELLARRTGLIALATRTAAAELTVSADAGAIHEAVRVLLTRHLPVHGASHWTDRVTVPDGLAPPWQHASAAVVAGPTWLELGLTPADPPPRVDRSVAFAELMIALDGAPHWPEPGLRRRLMRRRLAHLVEGAAGQFGRRERTKAALLAIGGELRRIHLELGRRLTAVGVLPDARSIDLLTTAEMRSALRDDRLPGTIDLNARRRHVERHTDGPPLPARWRGAPAVRPAPVDGRRRLTGLAASAGRFTGRARRVDGPTDPIGDDEVLVASTTDPSWTPVLVRCGALVIERGGPLSHAAILAREFGLPAVFDVAGAVERLDGHLVVVDGDAGTVDVLDPDPAVADSSPVAGASESER